MKADIAKGFVEADWALFLATGLLWGFQECTTSCLAMTSALWCSLLNLTVLLRARLQLPALLLSRAPWLVPIPAHAASVSLVTSQLRGEQGELLYVSKEPTARPQLHREQAGCYFQIGGLWFGAATIQVSNPTCLTSLDIKMVIRLIFGQRQANGGSCNS